MHSYKLLALFSALAGQAAASDALREALGASLRLPAPTAAPTGDALVPRREVDTECFYSVLSELSPPEPSETELAEVTFPSSDASDVSECVVTAPASLSDEFLSYWTVISEWYDTVEADIEAVDTKCGADAFSIEVLGYCNTESLTMVFTASDNQTSSTVLNADFPTGTYWINAAPSRGGLTGFSVVVVALLSAALVL